MKKCNPVLSLFFVLFAAAMMAAAQEPDEISAQFLSNASATARALAPRGHRNGQGDARFGVSGIDSLVNFNKHFRANGVDQNGNPQIIWYYNMVGNPPELGGTTVLNAPIVPVSLDLRAADGSPRFINGKPLISDVTPFIDVTLNSPVFQNFNYTSSDIPTQYTDAIQRAEFSDSMRPDWHTILAPSVKTTRVMKINQDPTCAPPKGHCNYRFALNSDGSCCRFVLIDDGFPAFLFDSLLFPSTFPFDNSTPVGAAENAGDITTKDVSTFLFPNAYLYFGNINNCCVLGYHSYDFEPSLTSSGLPQRRYVLNYSSWITPGLFGAAFLDVTGISHEMAEIFNDPFVASDGIHNITPWWLSPNRNCQDDMEVGDVIEGLKDAVFPITMNGFTYHPQNVALLQWFEFQSPSTAINGAYSYPDITTLTALSAPQKAGCAP
jgi:hypothetical protein